MGWLRHADKGILGTSPVTLAGRRTNCPGRPRLPTPALPSRRDQRITETDSMAKAIREKIKLVSSAGTGYFYTTTKNRRLQPEKLTIRKYDPKARKHVEFTESKMK